MEKIFKKSTVLLSYLLIVTTVILIFAIPVYAKSERKIDFFSSMEITENIKNMEMNMTSVIYVQNEKGEWEEYQRLHGNENRIWVGIDKMPDNLKNAFIAIEDERFYEHSGVDWRRTFGAIGNFFFKFNATEFGGSTITQQLIKNVTMDNARNAYRKFREIIRANLIESNLNKTQILEAYLNTIALGNGICGVQVAANYYFNKEVADLTLAECASLAAITKNPVKNNPVTGKEKNDERRRTVLNKMLELEMISFEDYSKAYDAEITLDNSREDDLEAEINSYFVDALIDQVIADLAEKFECSEQIASTMLYNGGFKIYSTLNPKIQSAMEKVYLNKKKYFNFMGEDLKGNWVNIQSAMTIMDYEGHVVGLVGGVGEKTVNRGLNRAVDSPRQPGSTIKPISVYALAIEKDVVNYSSTVVDKPIDNYYGNGKKGPQEWYGYYKGNMTLNYAIRKSANTIPVKLLQDMGIDDSYNFLKNKLHCKYITENDKNLAALGLGGCTYGITTTESAAAFAIFGNNGVYHKPSTYFKIERVSGEVVLDYDETGEQVLTPATATIMNHLLQEVVYGSEGTGSTIAGFSSMKAFAKTGTSSEVKDLWMVAGSPYYVGSVWCGFDKQQEINSSTISATIWKAVMTQVHKGLEKKTFTDSEDVYKKGAGYYKKGSTPQNIISSSSEESSSEEVLDTPPTETPQAPTDNTAQTSSGATTTPSAPSGGSPSPTPPIAPPAPEKPESSGGSSSDDSESDSSSNTDSKPESSESTPSESKPSKPTPPDEPGGDNTE